MKPIGGFQESHLFAELVKGTSNTADLIETDRKTTGKRNVLQRNNEIPLSFSLSVS